MHCIIMRPTYSYSSSCRFYFLVLFLDIVMSFSRPSNETGAPGTASNTSTKKRDIFGVVVELGFTITIGCNSLNLLKGFDLISRDNYTTEKGFLLTKLENNN